MDETKLQVAEERKLVAARSEMYKLLSSLFAYPAGELSVSDFSRSAMAALRGVAAGLPYILPALDAMADGLSSVDIDAAESSAVRFTRFFDNCQGRVAVSLYEKDYGNGDAKIVWEEVIRFYEHFGLAYDLRQTREWPDFIGTELEFLHYLTFLEAGAADAASQVFSRAQGDFLERHLAKWTHRLAARLGSMAESFPFNAFAAIIDQFIDNEMAALGRVRAEEKSAVPLFNHRELDDKAWIPIFPDDDNGFSRQETHPISFGS